MIKSKLLVALTLGTFCSMAQVNAHYNAPKGLALDGYDAVAYFAQRKAVRGDKKNSATVQGITYYFQSKENKVAFEKDPASYLPQYGGWCAYAMGATGEKVEVDPETFKIRDGKLYLFYNSFFNNTLPKWNEDEAKLEKNANTNWSKIITARQSQ